MKVLILNSILYTSETDVIPHVRSIKDTMIYGVCLGFLHLGHNVTLATLEDYRPIGEEQYEFPVIFFKSNFKKVCKPSVFPYSLDMNRYLKEHGNSFDLVISSEVFQFQSLYAARACPHKTIIWQELTAHQNKFHKIPSKLWYNIVARLFMRNVRCVVPRSKKAYTFVRQYMPNVSATIIDHGINIDTFKYSTEKKRMIISSSQLIFRKNVDGIIRKFARFHMQKGYEDIRLIIAGRGEEESKLKDLTAELGLQDYVDFVGFLPHTKLNEYIRHSYALLVNTRKDLNMVSIPEAIVSGTPILTNLQPASADYIAVNSLGIAKDDWDEKDMKAIVDDNMRFVKRCIAYREKLTNVYSARSFIEKIQDNK